MVALSNDINLPDIDVIVPTLNAASVLNLCLGSLKKQKYPRQKIHLYIVDGGSTDTTTTVAVSYGAIILQNPLKSGESGKAVGYHHSHSQYVFFLDSDNILPSHHWLTTMMAPLVRHQSIVGVEPIRFTYRRQAGYIERYSSLFGANDPYTFVVGTYDRENKINYRWTNLTVNSKKYPGYIHCVFQPLSPIPTIGANGTIYRRSFLDQVRINDYVFDVDIIPQFLKEQQSSVIFAKVDTSIIHTYCEASFTKFLRKQERRVRDLYSHSASRYYPSSYWPQVKFSLYSLSIMFPLFDAIRGYRHLPDIAWFFHPLACITTLYIYSKVTLLHWLGQNVSLSRRQWSQ